MPKLKRLGAVRIKQTTTGREIPLTNCPEINNLLFLSDELRGLVANNLLSEVEKVVGRLTPAKRKKLTAIIAEQVDAAVGGGWQLGGKAEQAHQSFARSGERDVDLNRQTVEAINGLIASGMTKEQAFRTYAEETGDSPDTIKKRFNRKTKPR